MKKCLIGASMTLTGLTALLILFILYPNNLFAKKTTYKIINFQIMGPALARSLDNNIMLNIDADDLGVEGRDCDVS